MNLDIWTNVDHFFEQELLDADPILDEVLARCAQAGLPPHNVSPCQGQFLRLITMLSGARRVLEIGTLGGYSTIWFARALPRNGRVVTIEYAAAHAAVAKANFRLAGVADRVQLLQGDAQVELRRLIDQKTEPFDLVFIDADKPSNPAYLDLCLRLSRPGTAVIADNVVREGAVANAAAADAKVAGVRAYCRQLKSRGLISTGLQTVGMKGYDGFALSIVR